MSAALHMSPIVPSATSGDVRSALLHLAHYVLPRETDRPGFRFRSIRATLEFF